MQVATVRTDAGVEFRLVCLERQALRLFPLLELSAWDTPFPGESAANPWSRHRRAVAVKQAALSLRLPLFKCSPAELSALKLVGAVLPHGPTATLAPVEYLPALVRACLRQRVTLRSVLPPPPILVPPQTGADQEVDSQTPETLDARGLGYDHLDAEEYHCAEQQLLGRLSRQRAPVLKSTV